jgi:6-pyruvoyltetrahydropterin/6-carboxytetrahydropterin synthase
MPSRLDRLGMVIDFADLKAIVERVVGKFDHAVINDHPPFDTLRNTTAEELARYVHEQVSELLPEGRSVRRVEIWETDGSCASYEL